VEITSILLQFGDWGFEVGFDFDQASEEAFIVNVAASSRLRKFIGEVELWQVLQSAEKGFRSSIIQSHKHSFIACGDDIA
jgi:hypothetical protein